MKQNNYMASTENQRERVISDSLAAVVKLLKEVKLVMFEHKIHGDNIGLKTRQALKKFNLESKILISKILQNSKNKYPENLDEVIIAIKEERERLKTEKIRIENEKLTTQILKLEKELYFSRERDWVVFDQK